jgi:hypothetical protein
MQDWVKVGMVENGIVIFSLEFLATQKRKRCVDCRTRPNQKLLGRIGDTDRRHRYYFLPVLLYTVIYAYHMPDSDFHSSSVSEVPPPLVTRSRMITTRSRQQPLFPHRTVPAPKTTTSTRLCQICFQWIHRILYSKNKKINHLAVQKLRRAIEIRTESFRPFSP